MSKNGKIARADGGNIASRPAPLSSIRDAPPNCKRFAEIFAKTGVKNENAPKRTRTRNGPRRTVALGVGGLVGNATGLRLVGAAKFSTFFRFLRPGWTPGVPRRLDF